MLLVIVSLQVHSMYLPGVSCQFAGHAGFDCLLVVVSVRASYDKHSSQSPCGVEFTTVVVVPLPVVIPLLRVVLLLAWSNRGMRSFAVPM